MYITSSALSLDGQRELSTRHQVQERLRFGTGTAQGPGSPSVVGSNAVQLDISDEARARLSQVASESSAALSETASSVPSSSDAPPAEPRMLVLARMIEALTGVRVRIVSAAELNGQTAPDSTASAPPSASNGRRVGWSLSYDRISVRTVSETLQFNAQGVVHTDDGRTIAFQTTLQLQRSVTTVEQFSLRAGEAARPMKDPLVLHFDGALPQLSDTRFSFDVDADGQTDEIPFVGQGSGMLVLDRNSNGQIDDGRELFGALSGDGFADLSRLDSDGNGWIDEADPAFERLQVWQKDAGGTDHYRSLQDMGVGALSVARTSTPYTLQGASGTVLGQIKSSGVYLMENGQSGLMQQIDLAV